MNYLLILILILLVLFIIWRLFAYLEYESESKKRYGKKTKHEKVTTRQMAEILSEYCLKHTTGFSKRFSRNLDQLSRDFKLDTTEVFIMNLWIMSKALSLEKKVLGAFENICAIRFFELNETSNDDTEIVKIKQNIQCERFDSYNEAWGDNYLEGNDIWLAKTMIEYLLNKGKPDPRLNNFHLVTLISLHVKLMWKNVLELKKEFEISD